MTPDNCECCPLEIGDGADCKRSRYDDEKQEVVPGNQCPFVLLSAKERELKITRLVVKELLASEIRQAEEQIRTAKKYLDEMKAEDAAIAQGGE